MAQRNERVVSAERNGECLGGGDREFAHVFNFNSGPDI